MFEVSEIIRTILSGAASLTGIKNFPLIADQKERSPFIVYYVSEEPSYSKNGKNDYSITIQCYHNTYNDAILLAGKVTVAMNAATEVFKYSGAVPEFNNEDLIRVTQTYQYKK